MAKAHICAATGPHLRRDWPTSAPRLAHICTGTRPICAGTHNICARTSPQSARTRCADDASASSAAVGHSFRLGWRAGSLPPPLTPPIGVVYSICTREGHASLRVLREYCECAVH